MEGGLVAVYRDGMALELRELLCAQSERERIAMAIGHALGCASVRLYSPSARRGERFIPADEPLPQGCYWPLALD